MSSNKFSFALFIFSVLAITFMLGYLVHRQYIFPTPLIEKSWNDLSDYIEEQNTPWYDTWYFKQSHQTQSVITHNQQEIAPGLTFVTGITKNKELFAKVINQEGKTIHSWNIDWFTQWPDSSHLPESVIPKSLPGTIMHGFAMLKNGDIVFNYDEKGMLRMDPCSHVVWRLPYRTHHSIDIDDKGHIWAGDMIDHTSKVDKYPNLGPQFKEDFVTEVSQDGKIISRTSVFEILKKNGYQGLLYLSTKYDFNTQVSGDPLHLNDVEIFPESLPEGVFKHGDIMLSMRNIDTVLVYDPKTLHIKFISTGKFIRQHDPDFIDGNTIMVFDNNNLMPKSKRQYKLLYEDEIAGQSSKVVTLSAIDKSIKVIYEGTSQDVFFTSIMGKQQPLSNGNILITDSRNGHAFEINNKGETVWEYYNIPDEKLVGLITEAQRLPPEYDEAFFQKVSSQCQ